MCIRDFWPIDCGPQAQRLARDYCGYTTNVEGFTQATLIPAWNLIRSVVRVQNRFSTSGVPYLEYIILERNGAFLHLLKQVVSSAKLI
jgi:hypothetical protein